MDSIDFVFATPAIRCDISLKLCQRQGKCSECPDANYMVHFDEEKVKRIIEEINDE